MKKLTVLNTFLLIVLSSISSSGQENQFLEYQNKTYIQIDSAQLSNANATRVSLEGCIEVAASYHAAQVYTDSLIPALKAASASKDNRLTFHEEKDVVQQQEKESLEKAIKKQKRKNIGNSILLTTFAISSAALMVLYLTK